MNEKKKNILEKAMLLFATKGYHSTSMQEVAEHAGVSKGALYIHFTSKSGLLVEIYRYYHEKVKMKMDTNDTGSHLYQKKRLQTQIKIYLEELLSQKEFILMHINENVSYCKELDEFMQTAKEDAFKWYEESLIGIYGEEIRPYVIDLSIILKGMIESYLITLFSTDIVLSLDELTAFILSRLDDLVEGIVKKKENPPFLRQGKSSCGEITWRQQLEVYFLQLENMIADSGLEGEVKEDCFVSIEFLKEEVRQGHPKKIIFQGILNNLTVIPETKEISEKIVRTL